jgi:hypothetical protein
MALQVTATALHRLGASPAACGGLKPFPVNNKHTACVPTHVMLECERPAARRQACRRRILRLPPVTSGIGENLHEGAGSRDARPLKERA